MHVKLSLALTLIVLFSCFDCGESWLIRWRRTRHTRTVNNYRCQCIVICRRWALCNFNCGNSCGGKKRELEEREAGTFELMLPCQFAAWDLNKDNVIDQQEFAFDAHVDQNDVNTKLAFTKCDTNGDGTLSKDEFSKAPIQKERC